MKFTSTTVIQAAIVTTSSVLVLGLGFLIGRYHASLNLQRLIAERATANSLGQLLGDDNERKATSAAYLNPDEVLASMDTISWAPPNLPTPFVGAAPTPGEHGTAKINAMQFRHDAEIALPAPDDVYRIFLTGGSTAFGTGAPAQDRTIGGYLGKLLNEQLSPKTNLTYEVITAANVAWTSTHERIFIENRLSELHPDMVISLSGNNDVHFAHRGKNILWFRAHEDAYFAELLKIAFRISGQPEMPENVPDAPAGMSSTDIAARLLKNVKLSTYALAMRQTKYVFVLQPTLAVAKKVLTRREREAADRAEEGFAGHQAYFQAGYATIHDVLSTYEADNFLYVSLAAVFDGATADDEIFVDSYHFGDRGNELIAKAIVPHIQTLARR